MKGQSYLKLLLLLLIATNIVCLGFIAKNLYIAFLWRREVANIASYAGVLQASRQLHLGKERILELTACNPEDIRCLRSHFTGRTSGRLQIWTWPYRVDYGYPAKFSGEQYVTAYNMRIQLSLYQRDKE